jgi:AraC-like DNA-binding protein
MLLADEISQPSGGGGMLLGVGDDRPVDGVTLRKDFLDRAGAGMGLLALDELPDVFFFVKDSFRRFVYYNRPFPALLQRRAPDSLLGLRDEDISPEYLVDKYRADDSFVLATGSRLVDIVELVHNTDGSYDWFTTTKFPIRDRDGEIIGVGGITRDLQARQSRVQRFTVLAPAIELIMANYHRTVTVEELAGAVSLSPSHFARAFRKRFDMSPQRYIRQVRLNAASDLLSTTDEPLSVIASRCGYTDQSHMTREFSSRKGLSPGRYRERYRRPESPTTRRVVM